MIPFRILRQLARGHGRQFALISLLALAATGLDLIQPLVYRRAINDVAGLFVEAGKAPLVPAKTADETFRTLIESVIALFFISVGSYWLTQLSDFRSTVVASRMESGLILKIFGHVLRLPLPFFATQTSAGLAKRIDQSDQLSPIVHAFSQQIAPEAVRLVGIAAIMLTAHRKMTLVAVCLLPLYLWLARRNAMHLQTGLAPYYEMWENISARINDALGAVKTVKLSGAEAREEERLRQESADAYAVYLKRIRTAQTHYLGQRALNQLSRAMVLGYGGWLVLRHELTPGDVVMFLAYLERLYSPIDSLTGIAVSLAQHAAALERGMKLLREGPVEMPGDALQPGPGRVEFRGVRFGYVPDREVLKGLDLVLEPGHITGLVGPSGAGKTTTSDLLLKLFEPHAGDILIDGQSLRALGPATVRQAIGVVAADGAVFRGTLADNIRYKRPGATDEEVEKAARAAGLGRLLERLPDGLATEIGERGVGLSVGERQRLQIARVLADQPRLLVLDEATANLDYATEDEFRRALLDLNPRPTMLVIAHRYSMVRDADRVYVLDAGQVTEHGTPAQLIEKNGWFAELARQSGDSDLME